MHDEARHTHPPGRAPQVAGLPGGGRRDLSPWRSPPCTHRCQSDRRPAAPLPDSCATRCAKRRHRTGSQHLVASRLPNRSCLRLGELTESRVRGLLLLWLRRAVPSLHRAARLSACVVVSLWLCPVPSRGSRGSPGASVRGSASAGALHRKGAVEPRRGRGCQRGPATTRTFIGWRRRPHPSASGLHAHAARRAVQRGPR
jgi:hypothetical protein